MADKKGRGLLMVWTDVPADRDEEFNRWYAEEHLAELLAIPGFLNGARYEAVSGGPKYLACYELESADVIESPPYRTHFDNPTPWSRRMSPRVIGINWSGNTYRQIFPDEVASDVAAGGMAPALVTGRLSVDEAVEDEFNRWYDGIYIPGHNALPGCIRGRRYVATRGEPRYLTMYELEHENVVHSPEWLANRTAHPQTLEMRTHMTHAPGSPGVYRKFFEL